MIVSPSIMTADFMNLAREIGIVERSGTQWLHLDVMDGNFVPNISFGPKLISDARSLFPSLFFDAHLMVNEPDGLLDAFAKAGCSCLTVHPEAIRDVERTIALIKALGMKAGVSIKPSTSVEAIRDLLDKVSLVLVMSVEPGFGGQAFMPDMAEKVRELKSLRGKRDYLISIDGGISRANLGLVRSAGCDVAVVGSAFFKEADPSSFVRFAESL